LANEEKQSPQRAEIMERRIFSLAIFILITAIAFGQPKPKPKEKPPTQKEIDEMMREAQKEMSGMSAEEKKMMDSLGFKMPDLKNIPKFTDKQYQESAENSDGLAIPKRDAARIAMVNRKPMTAGQMESYIKTTTARIEQRMDAKKLAAGKEAYASIKASSTEPNAVANTASACWMMGALQPAIYLMGRACQEQPGNPDHLNNYAAFLTMARAEESALPILYKLNKDYPKNSTVLNNIGQAWFGLGDIATAEKYLDSAIAVFKNHAQANYTKAMIENSKGNKQGAVAAMKRSIARGYSAEKQSMLKQFGYTLNGKDVPWKMPMPQDALGLAKFAWPDYPKNTVDSKRLEVEWRDFIEMCNKRINELGGSRGNLDANFNDAFLKNIQAASKGQSTMDVSRLSKKAGIKLDYIMSNAEGSLVSIVNKEEKELQAALKEVDKLEELRDQELQKVHDQFKPLMGEGKSNPFAAYCAALTAVQNNFLGAANSLLESNYKSYLKATERMINERAYYIQYTLPLEAVEKWKLNEKQKWLGYISSAHPVRFDNPNEGICNAVPLPKTQAPKKLTDFEDLHCPNVVELSIGLISWKMACGKSHYEGGIGPIDFNLDYNDWKEQIIRGSVELGEGKSIGVSSGPMVAKLEGKLAGFIEFDNTGITDVGIIAGVEAKAGVEVDSHIEYVGDVGRTMSIGATTRMGWNSGSSTTVFSN
jgi:Tfp pilus assembly protein PilF